MWQIISMLRCSVSVLFLQTDMTALLHVLHYVLADKNRFEQLKLELVPAVLIPCWCLAVWHTTCVLQSFDTPDNLTKPLENFYLRLHTLHLSTASRVNGLSSCAQSPWHWRMVTTPRRCNLHWVVVILCKEIYHCMHNITNSIVSFCSVLQPVQQNSCFVPQSFCKNETLTTGKYAWYSSR